MSESELISRFFLLIQGSAFGFLQKNFTKRLKKYNAQKETVQMSEPKLVWRVFSPFKH